MLKKSLYCLLSCIVLFQFACSNRPDDVLTPREMRSFLTDLHLLEGVFSSGYNISEDEKKLYYYVLFQKHGITKAQFDSSLVYYTKNPKMFERIYTRVNKNLEELKSDVEAGKYLPVIPDSIKYKPVVDSIWDKTLAFTYPDDTLKHKNDTLKPQLYFSMVSEELMTKDVYTFSFRMRANPYDSVKTGYTTFRIHYADGNIDSLWHEVKNDSVLRRYKFRFKAARNIKIDSLSGVFYADQYQHDTIRIRVDNIMLLRKYVPALQDSLRLKLDTVPLMKSKKNSLKVKDSIPVKKTISEIKSEIMKKE